jgi:hypothetical protein
MTAKNPLGNGREPQSYEGLNIIVPLAGWQLIKSTRNPTTNDKKYPVGAIWINTANNTAWLLNSAPGNWTEFAASVAGAIISITGDSGGAELPSAGNFNIKGTANQVVVTGSAATETISLTGPYTPATYTAHGVLVGEGTSSIVATTAGTTGQVLIGSTAADPAFGALGLNSGLTAHGVLLGENNSAIVATTAGTTGQVLIGSTGADPAFGALGLNSGLTSHGVLLGENNSAIVATAAGSTGQVLAGVTGADPTFQSIPALNVVDVTTTTQAMAVNTTYISDHASALVVFTLPATAVQGTEMTIVGNGPGGWQIAQNANQQIKGFGQLTTSGTSGSLNSTNRFDGVTLIATVGGASTIWVINDFAGSFTFV